MQIAAKLWAIGSEAIFVQPGFDIEVVARPPERLVELLTRHNRAGKKSLVIPGEYLEAVVTKR